MNVLYGFFILLVLFAMRTPGQIWHEKPAAGGPSYISFLAADRSVVYAGTWGSGVYVSADTGVSWAPMNNGLSNTYIYALLAEGDFVLAGTEGGGIFKSGKYGRQWRPSNRGLEDKVVFALIKSGNVLAASTWQGGVFVSSDSGETWKKAGAGLGNSVIYSVHANGGTLYAGTSQNGAYRSEDNGAQWENIGLGGMSVLCILTVGDYVMLGTWKNGIYRYSHPDNELTQIAPGGGEMVKSAAVRQGGNTIYCAKRQRGVYTSPDYGHTWTFAGLEGRDVYSILSLEDRIIAGTWGDGIFIHRDRDTGWVNRSVSPEPETMPSKKTEVVAPKTPLFNNDRPVRKKASVSNRGDVSGLGRSRIMNIKACSKENITVCYKLKYGGRISIVLYDYRGREILGKTEDAKEGTVQKTEFSKHGLAPGLYFVVLASLAHTGMMAIAYVTWK